MSQARHQRCKWATLVLILWTIAALPFDASAEAVPRFPKHSNLLVGPHPGDPRPRIDGPNNWTRRREAIVDGMEQAMGPLPSRADLGPLDEGLGATYRDKDFTRVDLSFASGDGDRVTSHLYVPTGIKVGERRPALLALHPTSPLGKKIVAGLGPRPNRNYGEELARRGYIVLAPDYPSFGELSDYDFEADGYVSGTMKGIFNHMRCLDYLQTRPDVDSSRLGVIGHSLGGHNAMFVAVFDPRLKVIVSSCGWTPFHDYYAGKIAGWTSDLYMPRLKTVYGLDPDRVPFDFYEVVAALAPRGFFSSSPLRDSNFEVTGVMKAIPKARRVYRLFGHADRLQVRYPSADHDFPPSTRAQAYRFIDQQLNFLPSETAADIPVAAQPAEEPTAHFTGPWDMLRLSKPPSFEWGAKKGLTREVYYENVSFKGKPTRVFAYYAAPEQTDGPLPAMLLAYGGGGRAFPQWATLWAQRGYAALAMDFGGKGPDGRRLTDGGPNQSDDIKFREFDSEQVTDMWTYHAVAAIIRGHSLIASFDEVDPDRIGLSGISWGGYLTCIVSGVDRRLKVSVPVYGCGFLHDNSAWRPRFAAMDAAQRDLWISFFDPSRYLAGVESPILLVNGTNDFAYPLDSYQQSYDMVPGPVDLCVRVRMPHGHEQGWRPSEIGRFVDGVLRNGPGLARIGETVIKDKLAKASFTAAIPIISGQIHYCSGSGPWQERQWESRSATIVDNIVQAPVPAQRPLVFYLSITDENGDLVSSPHRVLR